MADHENKREKVDKNVERPFLSSSQKSEENQKHFKEKKEESGDKPVSSSVARSFSQTLLSGDVIVRFVIAAIAGILGFGFIFFRMAIF